MARPLEHLGAFLLSIMFLVTLYQVAARAVGLSSVWSEELARFLYVCLVFVGTIPLMRDDEHIRAGVIVDRLRGRVAITFRLLTTIVTVPFIAVMTWGAWTNTRLNWHTYAPTLDWLCIGYIYLVICGAGLLMLWYLATNLRRHLEALFGKRTRGVAR